MLKTQSGLLKRHSKIFHLLQQYFDIAIICISLYAANAFYNGSFQQLSTSYLTTLVVAVGAWYFFASSHGLYQSWRSQQLLDLSTRVIRIWLMVLVSLILLGWALKTTDNYSRVIMSTWAISSPLLMIASRMLMRFSLLKARSQGHNSRNIAIAGTGPSAEALIDQITENAWMGYKIAGVFCDKNDTAKFKEQAIAGNLSTLAEHARDKKFDAIFLALPMSEEQALSRLITDLSDCSIPVHLVPDLFTFQLLNTRLSSIGTLPLLSIYDTPHNGVHRLLKRLEDVLLASVILLLISPLMLVIALAIKLNSKGPVIFKQQRYGMKGEAIAVWKFRSMSTQDNGSEIKQATKNDSRITSVGAFLRKTSLDELPQFINVLQGCMSIVGPRPHAVAHNELYRKAIDGYMLRHLVKPGITGWAQINGWRGETDTLEKMQKRVEFDLFYIRNWSLLFDLKIITLTIFKGFLSKNAY